MVYQCSKTQRISQILCEDAENSYVSEQNIYKIPRVLAFLNLSVAINDTLEYFQKGGKTSLVKTSLGVLIEKTERLVWKCKIIFSWLASNYFVF